MTDPRRLGRVRLQEHPEAQHPLASLGFDVLEGLPPPASSPVFSPAGRGRSRPCCSTRRCSPGRELDRRRGALPGRDRPAAAGVLARRRGGGPPARAAALDRAPRGRSRRGRRPVSRGPGCFTTVGSRGGRPHRARREDRAPDDRRPHHGVRPVPPALVGTYGHRRARVPAPLAFASGGRAGAQSQASRSRRARSPRLERRPQEERRVRAVDLGDQAEREGGSRIATGSSGMSRSVSRITRRTTAASSAALEPAKTRARHGCPVTSWPRPGKTRAESSRPRLGSWAAARPFMAGRAKQCRDRVP